MPSSSTRAARVERCRPVAGAHIHAVDAAVIDVGRPAVHGGIGRAGVPIQALLQGHDVQARPAIGSRRWRGRRRLRCGRWRGRGRLRCGRWRGCGRLCCEPAAAGGRERQSNTLPGVKTKREKAGLAALPCPVPSIDRELRRSIFDPASFLLCVVPRCPFPSFPGYKIGFIPEASGWIRAWESGMSGAGSSEKAPQAAGVARHLHVALAGDGASGR